MRINDRGNCIGGVVEAIDEFESERDQQRHKEQQVGQVCGDFGAGLRDIAVEAVGDEQEGGANDAKEDNDGAWINWMIELGSSYSFCWRRRNGGIGRGNVGHEY